MKKRNKKWIRLNAVFAVKTVLTSKKTRFYFGVFCFSGVYYLARTGTHFALGKLIALAATQLILVFKSKLFETEMSNKFLIFKINFFSS